MHLTSNHVCYAAPEPGVVAYQQTFYTRKAGAEKMRLRSLELANDIYGCGQREVSSDNGVTWTECVRPYEMMRKLPQGVLRRMEPLNFVDPRNGYLLSVGLEGVLPNDNCDEGMSQYYLTYHVSGDGGQTTLHQDHVVQRGNYSPAHPIEPVWVGKNALMIDGNNSLISTSQGHLILAASITPLGPDGQLYNPGGGYTYHEVVLLMGHWQESGRIEWELGPRVALDPARSTRGAIEPTLTQMPDGRILMVMRGSNDANHGLPGHKWCCVSGDGGYSWSKPEPWRYSDGTPFYSPSSIAQFLRHSDGRYFWLGNICECNPRGNEPRYPLYIGEVDPETLGLVRESLCEIDTLRTDDHPSLMLSNFRAHEDRENGDIILEMTRMSVLEDGTFGGDCYCYRLTP